MRRKQNSEHGIQTLQFCIQNPFSCCCCCWCANHLPERLNNSSQLIITLIRHDLESTKKKATKSALRSTTLFPRQREGEVEHSSCRNRKKKVVTKTVRAAYYSTNVMFRKQHKEKGEEKYARQGLHISQCPCRSDRDSTLAMVFRTMLLAPSPRARSPIALPMKKLLTTRAL